MPFVWTKDIEDSSSMKITAAITLIGLVGKFEKLFLLLFTHYAYYLGILQTA